MKENAVVHISSNEDERVKEKFMEQLEKAKKVKLEEVVDTQHLINPVTRQVHRDKNG
jgi:hypothetical protein